MKLTCIALLSFLMLNFNYNLRAQSPSNYNPLTFVYSNTLLNISFKTPAGWQPVSDKMLKEFKHLSPGENNLFGILEGKCSFFLNDYNLKIDNINEAQLISNLRLIMDKNLAYTKNIPTVIKTEKIIKNKRIGGFNFTIIENDLYFTNYKKNLAKFTYYVRDNLHDHILVGVLSLVDNPEGEQQIENGMAYRN